MKSVFFTFLIGLENRIEAIKSISESKIIYAICWKQVKLIQRK